LLLIISLAGYVPNSLYFYRGFSDREFDAVKIVERSLSDFRLCLLQAVTQVVMMGVMAYIVSVLLP